MKPIEAPTRKITDAPTTTPSGSDDRVKTCSNESSRDDDEHHNETELEHCLYHSDESEFGDLFRWDERNFNVEISMIDNFIDTFLLMNATASNDNTLSCDELREKGEKDNFVLYNVWCNDDGNGILVQHYYRD